MGTYFNPRSYKRSDNCSKGGLVYAYYFNPRSYKRSDSDFLSYPVSSRFQSTLLQEERPPAGVTIYRVPFDFNPRSYKRSDRNSAIFSFSVFYFNPRSYKRSDELYDEHIHPFIISIHAPTRGATLEALISANCAELFQSTLLQEERRVSQQQFAS